MALRLPLAFLLIAGASASGAVEENMPPPTAAAAVAGAAASPSAVATSSLRGAQSTDLASTAAERSDPETAAERSGGATDGKIEREQGGIMPEGWAVPEAAEGSLTETAQKKAPPLQSEAVGTELANSAMANATLGLATNQPACLCMFDIDRTLTGRQGDTSRCNRNQRTNMYDSAYGGGSATLSALASRGIRTTFCDGCVLGICSAGHGSGPGSDWNNYLLNDVMRGVVHDRFMQRNPIGFKQWSWGMNVISPFVLSQSNRYKQDAVELVRQWYEQQGLQIPPQEVYFFGDRLENIMPFQYKGFNSREVSCGSRDEHGQIGYCGATPEEVVHARGNYLCR